MSGQAAFFTTFWKCQLEPDHHNWRHPGARFSIQDRPVRPHKLFESGYYRQRPFPCFLTMPSKSIPIPREAFSDAPPPAPVNLLFIHPGELESAANGRRGLHRTHPVPLLNCAVRFAGLGR
jgi:hypothetical protein